MSDVYVQRVLPRWLVAMFGAATAVIVVAGMKAAASVIAPIFLALVLTVSAQPVLTWLRTRRVPQWLAVLLTLLAVYVVIIGLAVALAASVGQLASLLPQYSEQWNDLLGDVHAFLGHLGIGTDQVQSALRSIDLGSVVDFVGGLLSSLLGVTSNLLFVLATVLFMCVDAGSLTSRLGEVPGVSPGIGDALAGFARGTRSYLLVTTVFGFIVAAIDSAALFFMDIPLALVWGLVAFITNYIPNIGFIIGLAPPALLGLLVGGPQRAVLVIVVYAVINFVLQSVVQPKFVGDAVGLSVTVTFLSLVVWTWILGPLGAILAIPLSLLVKALLLDHQPGSRWALALVSSPAKRARSDPDREPPAHDDDPPPVAAPDDGEQAVAPSDDGAVPPPRRA